MVMMEGGVWQIDRPPALCCLPASSVFGTCSQLRARFQPQCANGGRLSPFHIVCATKAIILISDPLNPGDSKNEVTITRERSFPDLTHVHAPTNPKTGHTGEVGSSGGDFSYPQSPAGLSAHLGVPEHSSGFAIPGGARVG